MIVLWLLIAGLVGAVVGWLGACLLLVDCRREQWQLRDELRRIRDDLLRVEDSLKWLISKDEESPEIPDRSDGRPGPKHRTMWGDV